jgi:D-sedoheptulose 7-phosphate isomerase
VTDREIMLRTRVAESIEAERRLLDSDAVRRTAEAAGRVVDCLAAGGKVLFFGNGGSASDAGHLAAELLGRFFVDRRPLAAVALAETTAAMTAIGNDYGYLEVFARQVRALGRPGDVAIGLSTSGTSGNVVHGLATARELGLVTVAFTGASGGKLLDVAELCVRVPSEDTPRVQELCMLLGHTLCEIVERELVATRRAETATSTSRRRARRPGRGPAPAAHRTAARRG